MEEILETSKYSLDNVDWWLFAIKYVLGALGILVYAVWKVREHLYHFNFGILVRENKFFWAWAFIMVSLVLTILTISPDTSEALKSMIGLDVANEPGSFLLLGWSLSALANTFSKKKVDKKVNL